RALRKPRLLGDFFLRLSCDAPKLAQAHFQFVGAGLRARCWTREVVRQCIKRLRRDADVVGPLDGAALNPRRRKHLSILQIEVGLALDMLPKVGSSARAI